MTAFILACFLETATGKITPSGSIYFKSVNDCTYYAENLSGQIVESENGSQTYNCMCKLVPEIDPDKVKVY
tara:strand:- start:382 stop:594 length:213 start_codon:yes stop_codon:yes gene_type:complete